MLMHPTLEKLRSLKLFGMAQALAEQLQTRAADDLSFEARLGLLVDREATERDNRKLASLLRKANLRQKASLEDLDYKHPRGLDKSLMLSLASGSWLAEHRHVCVTGATGVGKTFIACALGSLPARLQRPLLPHQPPAARASAGQGRRQLPQTHEGLSQ
jgi:DNA replication protein DnaC